MPQITADTPFGAALKDLAADPRYKIYLEIGTFDGEGSTKCFIEGLEARTETDLSGAGLFSIEANRDLWMVASRYWQNKNPPARILWGRLAERMMGAEKVEAHPLFETSKEQYDTYYKSDLQHFLKAPLVRFRRADVVLLDGGEFCAPGDWDAVRVLKPKVVALTGTNRLKGEGLFKELFLRRNWRPILVGNGTAILESPGEADEFYSALPADGDHREAHLRLAEGTGATPTD